MIGKGGGGAFPEEVAMSSGLEKAGVRCFEPLKCKGGCHESSWVGGVEGEGDGGCEDGFIP